MNYATGYAFNTDEIFENFPYDKLLVTCSDCNIVNGDYHKDKLVKRVFKDALKLILVDIIDNNITFQLPTGSRRAEIHVLNYEGKQFKDARKRGKWLDVDFLASNFTGNQLVLELYGKKDSISRRKPIYVDKRLKDRLTEHTNNGKRYC